MADKITMTLAADGLAVTVTRQEVLPLLRAKSTLAGLDRTLVLLRQRTTEIETRRNLLAAVIEQAIKHI